MTTSRSGLGERILEHQTDRFLRRPASVRNAASVIVTVTTAVVFLSALAVRLLDSREFPTYGLSLWWAVQTATTVGYGDITPADTIGRIIGGIVMLGGISFLAIVTAAVTSVFVARAQRETRPVVDPEWQNVRASLDDLAARLDRIERAVGAAPADHPHRTMPDPGAGS